MRMWQCYLRIALRARSASGLLDALGLGYDLPVGQAVYAIDAFPDDDLLWRIEWIGGVGYNTSVPSEPQIDVCLAQLPKGEKNPLSARARSSQVEKRTAKIGVGLLPYVWIGSVWQKRRPVITNLSAYQASWSESAKSLTNQSLNAALGSAREKIAAFSEEAGRREAGAVYRAYLDGVPNGYAANSRTKEVQRWKAHGQALTAEQRNLGDG